MKRVPALEAVNGLELIAIQNCDVMVAGFDNDKEIAWIGAKNGLLNFWRSRIQNAAFFNLGLSPFRNLGKWCENIVDERRNCWCRQLLTKCWHLCRGAPLGNNVDGSFLAQPFQVPRNKRRALTAKPACAVAGGAVGLIERWGVRRLGVSGGSDEGKDRRGPGATANNCVVLHVPVLETASRSACRLPN